MVFVFACYSTLPFFLSCLPSPLHLRSRALGVVLACQAHNCRSAALFCVGMIPVSKCCSCTNAVLEHASFAVEAETIRLQKQRVHRAGLHTARREARLKNSQKGGQGQGCVSLADIVSSSVNIGG